jgi:RNA polymerase sigma-70 factor (ECF subfamily)
MLDGDMELAQLLQRAQGGERAAFDGLQQQLQPRLRRFIGRLLGSYGGPGGPEDEVLQDAFFSLYCNLQRINSTEHLLPFLFRVCRNLCYDAARRRRSRRSLPLEDASVAQLAGPRLSIPQHPAPDDAVAWGLLYGEVQRAIDYLPPLQQAALVLYSQEGLSYDQVAEAMGCDAGTVKSRIYYARRGLRRLLRPDVLEALGLGRKEK